MLWRVCQLTYTYMEMLSFRVFTYTVCDGCYYMHNLNKVNYPNHPAYISVTNLTSSLIVFQPTSGSLLERGNASGGALLAS